MQAYFGCCVPHMANIHCADDGSVCYALCHLHGALEKIADTELCRSCRSERDVPPKHEEVVETR